MGNYTNFIKIIEKGGKLYLTLNNESYSCQIRKTYFFIFLAPACLIEYDIVADRHRAVCSHNTCLHMELLLIRVMLIFVSTLHYYCEPVPSFSLLLPHSFYLYSVAELAYIITLSAPS